MFTVGMKEKGGPAAVDLQWRLRLQFISPIIGRYLTPDTVVRELGVGHQSENCTDLSIFQFAERLLS